MIIKCNTDDYQNILFIFKDKNLKELKVSALDIENICGQGYDNGAKMKGHTSNVQA